MFLHFHVFLRHVSLFSRSIIFVFVQTDVPDRTVEEERDALNGDHVLQLQPIARLSAPPGRIVRPPNKGGGGGSV